MTTFINTSIHTMAAVATVIDDLETRGHEVHTVTLVLNGQHGEFDLTVLATTDPDLEEVKATGIAHRSGGVSELVVVEPEEVFDVVEYRVTIDTMDEQYEYNVEATDEIGARQQALDLAYDGGLDHDKWHSIKVEEL